MNKMMLATLLSLLLFAAAYAGEITGTVKVADAPDNANAVAYIAAIPGKTFAPPEKHAYMDQKDLTFIPHVLPVLKGTTVDFHNSDDVQHNVFSPDKCAGEFNLGTWGKGGMRSYTFAQTPCFAIILCVLHPNMEAYVPVLPTPYFAVTTEDGGYEISDVPAGSYTLKFWYPDRKEQSMNVEIPKEGSITENVELRR